MTRKIFRTSLLVGLAALALSAGLFSWALVRHFTAKVYEELMVEVRLAAQGVRLGGRDYLEAVDSPARRRAERTRAISSIMPKGLET